MADPDHHGSVVANRLGVTWQGAKNLLEFLAERNVITAIEQRLGRWRSWVGTAVLEAVSD